MIQCSVKLQFLLLESLLQIGDDLPSKHARKHLDNQEELRAARDPAVTVVRETTAGNDAMQVGMKHEVLPPAMEDSKKTDAGAEVFRIGSNRNQSF